MISSVLSKAQETYARLREQAETGAMDAAVRRLVCLANGFGTPADYPGALSELVGLATSGCEEARSAIISCAGILGEDVPSDTGTVSNDVYAWLAARAIAARGEAGKVVEIDVEAIVGCHYRGSDDPADLFLADRLSLASIADEAGHGEAANCLFVLCQDPFVGYLRRAVPAGSCQRLWQAQSGDWKAASVYNDKEGNKVDLSHRDASVNLINPENFNLATSVVLHDITRAMSSSISFLEALQFVEYKPDQRFGYHHDYFSEIYVSSEAGQSVGGQRVTSFVMYLNDDYVAGETAFPDLGFKVRGSAGDVLMFKNVILGKYVDIRTRHGSIAVKSGVKRVLVGWTRQHCWTPDTSSLATLEAPAAEDRSKDAVAGTVERDAGPARRGPGRAGCGKGMKKAAASSGKPSLAGPPERSAPDRSG